MTYFTPWLDSTITYQTIIDTADTTNGCHVTNLYLTGIDQFNGLYTEMTYLSTWLSDTSISAIVDWTDGYKMSSHITLSQDGVAGKTSGTCFGFTDATNYGGVCHVAKAAATLGTTVETAGH